MNIFMSKENFRDPLINPSNPVNSQIKQEGSHPVEIKDPRIK